MQQVVFSRDTFFSYSIRQTGAKETDVRRKFSTILKSYGLGGTWEAGTVSQAGDLSKTIFKDKVGSLISSIISDAVL